MTEFYTSVTLERDLCNGCINCIKRCPTEAIRVRKGKAVITNKFCIDCGECIRICPYHAKKAVYRKMDYMKKYEYTVALPEPALYGQFNNLYDVNIILTGLKNIGFDDVFEVSAAAELVSLLTGEYVENNRNKWPIISTACPAVVRLISIKFPSLIESLLPIKHPNEIAADMARKRAMEKTGLPADKIGIICISPCPAKVTSIKSPIGIEKSNIDAVFAIKDIYPELLKSMEENKDNIEELSSSGKLGLGWGFISGEARGLMTENYLAADGIENVMRVLEELEENKIKNLKYVELNACSAGCVGGVMTVENPYVARVKLQRLRIDIPYKKMDLSKIDKDILENSHWEKEMDYKPVFNLADNMQDGIQKISEVKKLMTRFPGLDCGSCGAPTCKALAEDIVRGVANEKYCFAVLSKLYKEATHENQPINRFK
jgi:iron only hydrogenase large subunit-like protein